jgi:urease accessory protein
MHRFLPLLPILLIPSTTFAHNGAPGHFHGMGSGESLLSGLLHPLTGLDHLLAMVAFGLLAGGLPARERLGLIASFVGALLVGAVVGLAGFGLFAIEAFIALSIVVFGALLAADRNLPALMLGIGGGLFALGHGFAHGAEMAGAIAAPYFAGFLLTSSALLSLGVFIRRSGIGEPAKVRRPVGGALALVGVVFLAAGLLA